MRSSLRSLHLGVHAFGDPYALSGIHALCGVLRLSDLCTKRDNTIRLAEALSKDLPNFRQAFSLPACPRFPPLIPAARVSSFSTLGECSPEDKIEARSTTYCAPASPAVHLPPSCQILKLAFTLCHTMRCTGEVCDRK